MTQEVDRKWILRLKTKGLPLKMSIFLLVRVSECLTHLDGGGGNCITLKAGQMNPEINKI